MASLETAETYPFLATLGSYFNNDQHSDVIVKSGNHEFRAHKIVLSAHSPVFRSGLVPGASLGSPSPAGDMLEMEEPPSVVESFLYFMYHFRLPQPGSSSPYVAETDGFCAEAEAGAEAGTEDGAEAGAGTEAETNTTTDVEKPDLTDHISDFRLVYLAQMYACGRKWQVSSLAQHAEEKFRESMDEWKSTRNAAMARVIREVYASSRESDRTLRDVVVDTCCEQIEALNDQAWFNATRSEENAFAADLSRQLATELISLRAAKSQESVTRKKRPRKYQHMLASTPDSSLA